MKYLTPGGPHYDLHGSMLEQPHLFAADATGSIKPILNFLNALCYHADLDGISPEEITLDYCRRDLAEMKKDCDPADMPTLNSITPEMLRDAYTQLMKGENK